MQNVCSVPFENSTPLLPYSRQTISGTTCFMLIVAKIFCCLVNQHSIFFEQAFLCVIRRSTPLEDGAAHHLFGYILQSLYFCAKVSGTRERSSISFNFQRPPFCFKMPDGVCNRFPEVLLKKLYKTFFSVFKSALQFFCYIVEDIIHASQYFNIKI